MSYRVKGIVAMAVLAAVILPSSASPFAVEVTSYVAGGNAASGYADPNAVLGEPSRVTGSGQWLSDVTPFSPAYLPDQIVSVGAGGNLVVMFDHPVLDNPTDVQWGIDFLVFGNAMYVTQSNGTAGSTLAEPGRVAVSQDGVAWYDIVGATADGAFPTMGFTDTSAAAAHNGTTESDFLIPVDPSYSAVGETYEEILAAYAGSGGGTGVDFSTTGLSWIQYVKVYQDVTDGWSTEVDGFADVVPEPATVSLLAVAGVGLLMRRRRRKITE